MFRLITYIINLSIKPLIQRKSMAQENHLHIILAGWERYFDEMTSFLRDLNRRTGIANQSYCEYAVERLEICAYSVFHLINQLQSGAPTCAAVDSRDLAIISHYVTQLTELLECLRGLWREWLDHTMSDHFPTQSLPNLHRSSNPGRPKFIITKEQLQYLRSMSFSWIQISKLLNVSYMTIYRRRHEFRMSDDISGVPITDNDLEIILHHLRHELPSFGQTMVWGRIRSMGFKVTREQVRRVMRRSDPINTALRWCGQLVQRQPYSVPGPNSLWHLGYCY